MKYLQRFRNIDWQMAMVTLAAAGVVHICATFAAPALVVSTAYGTLKEKLPLNSMVIMPPIGPGTQPLPFFAPDVRYAMCRYETNRGPIAIRVVLPDAGWTLALYAPDGSNFYTATGVKERSTTLTLQLMPSDERFMGITPEATGRASKRNPSQAVATRAGIAIIRAPDKGIAYRQIVEKQLRSASCAVTKF